MVLEDGTLEKMQAAVRTLIQEVGEDPLREGLIETPRVRPILHLINPLYRFPTPNHPNFRCFFRREWPRHGWT